MFGHENGSSVQQHTADVSPFDSRHTNGVREGLGVFAVVVGGSFVGLSAFSPESLSRFWVWFLVVSLAIALGLLMARLIRAAGAPHKDVSPEVLARVRAGEKERQIEAAKARGDFDRFGK